jgi:UDP-glucose 4-epimerase
MKVIVTGGCGFIGSHIVDKLVEMCYDVIVIDDLSASENEKFYFNDSATYHKLDISNFEDIEPFFEGVDYVFHLAAESRIQPAIKNPSRAYKVNVIGTLNILESSKKHNIKRVIYSSTSSVYGLSCELPTKETESIDCLNPYSHSKFQGEELFRQYYKMYGLDSVIFRYFNVFGERSPVKGQYAPVVGIFINQMKQSKPLTIVSDGLRKRDFIYVGDIVDVNVSGIFYDGVIGASTFNIGSGENISIYDIARIISDNCIHLEDRPGEADNTLANISKAKEVLGFSPKTDVTNWIINNINNINK